MLQTPTRHYLAKYLSRYYLKGNYVSVLTTSRAADNMRVLRLYKKTFSRSGGVILKKHREIELSESFYRELSEFLPVEMNISRQVHMRAFINALVTRQEIIDELLLTL